MENHILTLTARSFFQVENPRARWAGVFLALAVTCLLSLIPMKVPAMNPFWQQDAFQSEVAMTLAAAEDHVEGRDLGQRRAVRFGARDGDSRFSSLDPLSPQSGDRGFEPKIRLSDTARLYAGIRANPRIPAKRVRQIALPPPTPFNLRAPPAHA
jgi:hypothetical protein